MRSCLKTEPNRAAHQKEMIMTNRTRTLMATLIGSLALATSATAFADRDHGDYRGHGWGHEKHARWHHQHQHRYDPGPYGYISFQSAPTVVYAPPVYAAPRYAYPAPPVRYAYPIQPSFSFGMTVPLD